MNLLVKRSQVEILGRAWVYDTGDPDTVDLWEHEFEPMESGRSGADWACEHLLECHRKSTWTS